MSSTGGTPEQIAQAAAILAKAAILHENTWLYRVQVHQPVNRDAVDINVIRYNRTAGIQQMLHRGKGDIFEWRSFEVFELFNEPTLAIEGHRLALLGHDAELLAAIKKLDNTYNR